MAGHWAAAKPPEFWQSLAGSKLTAVEIESLADSGIALSQDSAAVAQRAFDSGVRVRLMEDGLAPGFLFVSGQAEALQRTMVALVGTRKASAYGLAAAQSFAQSLASAGITVVSGGARGIDAAAHQGALESGQTAVVLPSGVDFPYPAGNRQLFDEVRHRGCLVSEFACGSGAVRESFLVRNRTIARLSIATVVIEAPEASGALVTARHALAMGKPVYVVPGPITLPSFLGGYRLLEEGATLAADPAELSARFGCAVADVETEGGSSVLLDLLASGPMSAEALGRESGLSPGELMEALTSLELEGRVTRAGNGYACTL
ncbi:MAG: DNA-processing protein DprA [Fimbriimonadaceae bacterium]